MDSILNLLIEIKKRPAMYITRNSISCLKAFLDGWYLRSPNDIVDADVMGEFQDWIVLKYQITSDHSWADIILFYSGDENIALKKFFEQFETFLVEREKNL